MSRPAPQYGRHVAQQKRLQRDGRWAEYSRRKNEWIKQNPAATSREIELAARAIAQELRL